MLQRSAMPLCLVTGATGFIGAHLCRRLLQQGYRVRALVRAASPRRDALADLPLEMAGGDLTEPETIFSAMQGCQYLFHCGAMVSDWGTVEEIRRVNVDGTRHVMAAALAAGVKRVIHLSTTDVYGYPGGQQVTEAAPVGATFRNWYAASKVEAEQVVLQQAASANLPVVVLRPATVYGPGSWNVVAEIAKAMVRRQMIVINRGRAIAGLCYIDHLLDAMMLALTQHDGGREAFNISDGLPITWHKFLHDLAVGLGCAARFIHLPYALAHAIAVTCEVGYRGMRKMTGLVTQTLLSRQAVQIMGIDQDFSIGKAEHLLGYQPRVSYATALTATLSWLRRDVLPACHR